MYEVTERICAICDIVREHCKMEEADKKNADILADVFLKKA